MIAVQEQILLAPYTTFEIGGMARYFVDTVSSIDVLEALQWAREHAVPFKILAGGSNVLVADEGFEGLVIHIAAGKREWTDHVLMADAGCNLLELIREAGERGFGGWESMAGIPGSIGGAARGNAGAFGTEIKDVLTAVHALNVDTGEAQVFSNAECEFAYRMSFFKYHPEWIITAVEVQLHPADSMEATAKIEETIAEREKRHLQNVRAAGSFFTNPVAPRDIQVEFEAAKNAQSREGRVPAGWLIDTAGFRGTARVGGAVCSAQHADYLVNKGGATAADVRALSAQIKEGVRTRWGIDLVEEADVW